MVGSGIFLLPSALAAYGATSILGWMFTAAGALLLALTLARLSRLLPLPGGPYAYTRKGFGDFTAFLVAWGYWLSICAGNAAIAVALVGYLGVFLPELSATAFGAALAALACIWLLTFVNCLGIRPASRVQLVTTVLKLLPLVALGTVGFLSFNVQYLTPFNPSGLSLPSAVNATAALTLWAFLGLESATIPSGRILQPEKTIPRATILGTLLTVLVYVLGCVVVMGLLPREVLSRSTSPFADAAGVIWGPWAAYAVGIGASISCFGALNGWILLQGQWPLAAARDGLFPRIFRRTSRQGTPVQGILLSSLIVTAVVATNYTRGMVEQFTFIILLATLATLIPYVFSTMSLLMLRIRYPEEYSRQVNWKSGLVALLAFLYSWWAVAGSGQETVYWGFLLLLSGIPVFVWLKWRQGGILREEEL